MTPIPAISPRRAGNANKNNTYHAFVNRQSRKETVPWVYCVGVRDLGTLTDTVTARGYDTISAGGQRNVGLVAGSFSERTDAVGYNINAQMLGVDMSFTPEPGATIALMSGLGLLGALAARRRR